MLATNKSFNTFNGGASKTILLSLSWIHSLQCVNFFFNNM